MLESTALPLGDFMSWVRNFPDLCDRKDYWYLLWKVIHGFDEMMDIKASCLKQKACSHGDGDVCVHPARDPPTTDEFFSG